MTETSTNKDLPRTQRVLVLTVGCINYDHDINHFEPIRRLFPGAIRYNYYERLQALGRRAMNRELLKLASDERPDYVFYITYQDQVQLRTLEEFREMGTTLIGWFSDDQWRFESFSRKLAKYLDFPVTTCPKAFKSYQAMGFRPVFCQWGSNPRYYRQTRESVKRYDVSFVGGCHGGRTEFIEGLRQEGIKVKTFGRGWNERISFEEMIRVFSESRINLNFSTSSVNPDLKQIKGRVFEIPMSGGFLLTEYADGLEDWFEIDREVASFRDLEGALANIKHYLSMEEERRAVAEAGRRRAMACHSWDVRLAEVFRAVEEMEKAVGRSPRSSVVESLYNRVFNR